MLLATKVPITSMNIPHQLKLAFYSGPAALAKMKPQSLMWAGIYLISGLAIFGCFFWLLIENQEIIKSSLLDYLFPESWHGISVKLANFLYESQTKTVLGNLILSGSLVLSSIFLFPLKEKYSAIFEEKAKYYNGKIQEFPLLYQAWEEVKLFLLYLTAQSVILWIGYYPYQWTTWISIILSYLFLFYTFGLDLISPTLQRHRTKYSLILKLLIKNWILPLSFGFLFNLPLIFLSRWIFTWDDYSLIEISSILFLSNMILLTLAVPIGTRIASDLLEQKALLLAPTKRAMFWGYTTMLSLLFVTAFLHSRLLVSLHHKSQLLKANYDIDWSSIEYQLPSFSEFTGGKSFSSLSFYMEMENPTDFDIVVENSQLFVFKGDLELAVVDVTGFELASKDLERIKIQLDSNSDLSKMNGLHNLSKGWRVNMHIELWPGIPLIINLIETELGELD